MIDAAALDGQNPRVASPMRRLLAVTALLLTAPLLAAGCAPAGPAEPAAGVTCDPAGLPTLTAGTLTVGTDQPVYPPWYVDDDPTSGTGFESAVAYAVADELGYAREAVTWVRVPFNAAIAPGPKTYDLNLTEFSITEERRAAVDFSAPYYDVTQAVIAIEGTPFAGATSIAELQGARLGAQLGTTSADAIVEQIAPANQPATFNSNDDAKLALQNGQIDALVLDLPTAFFVTSAELDGGVIVGQLPQGSGTPEQFGAVLDKDSPLTDCVSGAVDALRTAGTLDTLEQEWLASAGSAPELR